MFSSKFLLGAFAAFVLAGSAARAAAIDFTDLAGTYVGNYVIGVGGDTVTGRMTVTITVPENGKKATMQVIGRGAAPSLPGVAVALFGEHTFRANRSVSSNNALFAMYLLLPALPAKFHGNTKKFSFTLTSSVAGTSSSVFYTVAASGKSLRVTGVGELSSSPITVSLTAKRKGP